jgi:DNA-nicking Smr family endonuclease
VARGGRKTPKGPAEEKPAAEAQPAFRPFADALKGIRAPPGAPKPALPPPASKASAKPAPPPKKEKSDEDLLREGMRGVRPLSERERERVPRTKETPISPPRFDEDTEALAKLAALVDGQEPMTWEHSDEHSEWIAEDADPGILQRLVAGEFAWQGHIDLHGLTRDPARDAIVRFLASARVQGMRCVLVVHGRGHHSEDSKAVLKPLLQRWLQRAPLKEWVFAYATAKPVDGGAGAMYVLLRR